MLLLKLLYLTLSLIIFCFIMKNITPLHPLWPGLGGAHPPPPPSKSIPASHINLAYCVKTQQVSMNVQRILFF